MMFARVCCPLPPLGLFGGVKFTFTSAASAFFLVLPVFVRSVGLLIHFANSQEGALAEKYRAIHVQKNPDSKTFIVGEKNTQFGIC